MYFPIEIQIALEQYDRDKELSRRLFGDHPAIKALRNLPEENQRDSLEICLCFIKGLPERSSASFQVLKVVLKQLGVPDSEMMKVNNDFITLAASYRPGIRYAISNLVDYVSGNYTPRSYYLIQKIRDKLKHILAKYNSEIESNLARDKIFSLMRKKPVEQFSITSEITNLVTEHDNPKDLLNVLSALEKLTTIPNQGCYLTKIDCVAVLAHVNLGNVYKILYTLQEANLPFKYNRLYLTPKSRDAIMAYANNPEKLLNALFKFSTSHVNYTNITKPLLTPTILDALLTCASPIDLANTIDILFHANLLTRTNFASLFDNDFLYTAGSFRMVWERIPSRILTQVVFSQLIVLAQKPNPEQHIKEYVDHLLLAHTQKTNINDNNPPNDPKGYFAMLNLQPDDAFKDEFERMLTRNYRELARISHPDKEGGTKEKFQKLDEAYRVLSDPIQRNEYQRHENTASFRR